MNVRVGRSAIGRQRSLSSESTIQLAMTQTFIEPFVDKVAGKVVSLCRLSRSVFILTVLLLAGCGRSSSDRIQGYIEAEFIYVAAPLPGALTKLYVQRGAELKAGDPLFDLDSTPEAATREEAQRRLAQARANLDDASKGKRPSEIESLDAQLKQSQTALRLAEKELGRQEKLWAASGATTEQDVDRARSAHDQERQRVAQLQAELTTARLGSRPDQVAAAEANVRALEATLTKAEWELQQKRQAAPQSGLVFDTLYREGEWVPAGKPVVALLPPSHVKLRFFIPEPRLSSVHLGDAVQVWVDGAAGPVSGKISFVSPRTEYTPPVIYSRENRSKLVFLVEAVFEPGVAARLHPGQPVDVQFNSMPPP